MSTEQQPIERLCVECGKPILHPVASDLCSWCWMKKNDPETKRQEAEKLERERLMEELGMPLDAPCYSFGYDGSLFDDKGEGYYVDTFGILIGRLPKTGEKWSWIRFGGIVIQLWQQRTRYLNSQVFAEIRYHPDWGKTYAIKGEVLKASSTDFVIAKRGLKLLDSIERQSNAGRPPNSGVLTEENKLDALQLIVEIGRNIYQNEHKVSKSVIAEKCKGQYGITDDRSIYRVVTEYCKKSWKNDILPEIKKLNHS